jgi:hypothetical protein
MELLSVVPALAAGGVLAVGLYASWRFYRRYYQAVPPNRALVLYGGARPHGSSSGSQLVDVRTPRIIVGGGVFVPPWRGGSETLSLSPVDAEARVIVGSAVGDAAEAPWEVRMAVQVKIPSDARMLSAAAENLLGRSEAEIRVLVIRTVEAVAPAVVLRELSQDPSTSWDRLAAEIQAAVAPELVALGLEVRTLSVTNLRRFSAQERADSAVQSAPQMSRELLWASGDLGVRLRGTEVRLERTERSLGLLGAEVMKLGKDSSQFPELPTLQPYNSTEDERPARPPPRGSRRTAKDGSGGDPPPLLDAEG